MWKTIWTLIRNQEDLLDEAFREAVSMLEQDRRMLESVVNALGDDYSEEDLANLKRQDQNLNTGQQEIRRKVFEHLAVSRGDNLLQGLVLTSIVNDLERIGDYAKNIGELVQMFPGRLDFGEDEDLLGELRRDTLKMFELTHKAMANQNSKAAKQCMDLYGGLAAKVNSRMEEILMSAKSDSAVSKSDLALVMMLRFYKRVCAHLKNIASATVVPFPMIGYRLK